MFRSQNLDKISRLVVSVLDLNRSGCCFLGLGSEIDKKSFCAFSEAACRSPVLYAGHSLEKTPQLRVALRCKSLEAELCQSGEKHQSKNSKWTETGERSIADHFSQCEFKACIERLISYTRVISSEIGMDPI